MKFYSSIALAALLPVVVLSCDRPAAPPAPSNYDPSADTLRFGGEVHLRNIRQLTFGGNNAEAYFSFDNRQLIFQSDWKMINPQGCDQQFVVNIDGSQQRNGATYRLVSSGKGRTTCGYFLPDGKILYASTHGQDPQCPPPVRFTDGRYVWPTYADYDIYVAESDGSGAEILIGGPGYDAEATVSPDGRFVVFTSTRSGDLELWRLELGTGELLQLTRELGYDGGAFFSPDSQRLVWRASRPQGEAAVVYRQLLAEGLVEPSRLQIFVADLEGNDVRQVTDLAGANWAPFLHPDGERILFCSNHHTLAEGGREFDIFMIGSDGQGLEQITHSGTFDAFPMFSPDGGRLVFSSNRNRERTPSRETNIFVADWVEQPEAVDLQFEPLNPAQTEPPADP